VHGFFLLAWASLLALLQWLKGAFETSSAIPPISLSQAPGQDLTQCGPGEPCPKDCAANGTKSIPEGAQIAVSVPEEPRRDHGTKMVSLSNTKVAHPDDARLEGFE